MCVYVDDGRRDKRFLNKVNFFVSGVFCGEFFIVDDGKNISTKN